MTIVGGTYTEICSEPIWEHIFGSGFRAVNLFLENYESQRVTFYTVADKEVANHLDYFTKLYPHLKVHKTKIFKSPEFHYDHPLKTPTIAPRPDIYRQGGVSIQTIGENILVYGLLEASVRIQGKKVVYDPQSPVNPMPFSSTGSKAEQLITVVNLSEARMITGSNEIDQISTFFFENENCHALILKMGAQGALLFDSSNKAPARIPVYKTNKVWPIGSGDVFSAFFAFNWFNDQDLEKSVILASKATAIYCNSMNLSLTGKLESFVFPALLVDNSPTGIVYLAGPFFTFSERWLINEAWNTLKGFGLHVFSPFHDVGHGKAQDVVDEDLKGLDQSEIIFAIIDGLDPGTLFEVGYAVSQKKKVVAFAQNEDEEALKMLEGTDCIIEKDFTTAVYKTYWELATK